MQRIVFFRSRWGPRARNVLVAVILCAAISPNDAHAFFPLPPCLAPYDVGGCVFVSPRAPTPSQAIEVAVLPYVPADACVRNVTQSVAGNVVSITGTYEHCLDSYFPLVPPTILYYSFDPLPAGRYTVQFTAVPNPPDGWPFGSDGRHLGPISLATTLDVSAPPIQTNYTGLWWNSPPGSEPGWGISFAHQGDVIFAVLFAYDVNGKPSWLSMTATKTDDVYDTYTGALYQTAGPPFDASPMPPLGSAGGATLSSVGTATITFIDGKNAALVTSIPGFPGGTDWPITLQVFGPAPTCTFGAQPNLALATNYQDLWWAAPAGSEAGWGVSFAHQGDIIFATWFTYDRDRTPVWLSATAQKVGTGVYSGPIIRTSQSGSMVGAPFFLGPGRPTTFWHYDPATIVRTPVGTLTLAFSNGNSAAFTYTVDAVTQTKQITRQVFQAPGTVCQ